MRMFRRWQRRREQARELQLRSLAAMGYDPDRCFQLMAGNRGGRTRPLEMYRRKNLPAFFA